MFGSWSKNNSGFVSSRNAEPLPEPAKTPMVPETTEDFITLIRRIPHTVLSLNARARIAAVMSYEDKIIKDIMIPKDQIVFVFEKDFLGPITLDKLYRSGFVHFPVVDLKKHVVGILHTDSFNTLEIQKTDRAEKFVDKNFKTINQNDSLAEVVDKSLRSGCFFYIVTNDSGELVGLFTIECLLNFLLAQ